MRGNPLLNLRLLSTDYILPIQFFDTATEGEGFMTPERWLMYACLEDALQNIRQGIHVAASVRKQRLAKEAETWIDDNDTTWPFSFIPICHQLHIEPNHIRRLVRDVHAGKRTMKFVRTIMRNKGLNPNISR